MLLRSTGQGLWRCPGVEFVWFVFMIRLGLWVLGEKAQRSSVLFITSYQGQGYQQDLSPRRWPLSAAGVVLVRFLHYHSSLPIHSICSFRREVSVCRPRRAGIDALILCRKSIYLNSLAFFCMGPFLSPLLVYFHQCGLMDACFLLGVVIHCTSIWWPTRFGQKDLFQGSPVSFRPTAIMVRCVFTSFRGLFLWLLWLLGS